jgi:NADP-dependent 3-hydroxy acid dehydrogenase YdfG
MANLDDQAVIVKGAAAGIGLATADTLPNAGTNVAPADLHHDELIRLTRRICIERWLERD